MRNDPKLKVEESDPDEGRPDPCGFLCGCEKCIEASNDQWAWERRDLREEEAGL